MVRGDDRNGKGSTKEYYKNHIKYQLNEIVKGSDGLYYLLHQGLPISMYSYFDHKEMDAMITAVDFKNMTAKIEGIDKKL